VLQALDVFVLPSLNEGIANTILEAMATGLPIVATAIGGNVELVQDGVNGRTFGTGDDTSLANLLAEYADRPAMRVEHGRASRAIAQECFSLGAMTQRYTAVYGALSGANR
jgi:glycosyltransferase involved in cell wall biosynthesis